MVGPPAFRPARALFAVLLLVAVAWLRRVHQRVGLGGERVGGHRDRTGIGGPANGVARLHRIRLAHVHRVPRVRVPARRPKRAQPASSCANPS